MTTWTLGTILAPLIPEDFLAKTLGRNAAYAGGCPEKFRGLLPWRTVSDILTYSGLDAPRLRLEKGGRDIPSSAFCQPGLNGFPRIVVATMYRILREGATLIVDGMEGLNEPVARLCEAVELGVKVPAQVRFCACWGDGSDGKTRQNDHDVLVLQLSGTRAWAVQTHSAPLPWELKGGCLSGGATTQYLMEPGDVLYLPRGCAHSDEPAGAVASFLIVSFRNPTGLQFLGRVLERLQSSPALNTDFPRFAEGELRLRYLSFLQAEAVKALGEPGLLLGFMKDLWTISEPRTRVSLPWGASAEVLPCSGTDVVSLSARFPNPETLIHALDSAAVGVVHERQKIVLDECQHRIVAALLARPEMTVDALHSESNLSRDQLLISISEMMKSGLLLIRRCASETASPVEPSRIEEAGRPAMR